MSRSSHALSVLCAAMLLGGQALAQAPAPAPAAPPPAFGVPVNNEQAKAAAAAAIAEAKKLNINVAIAILEPSGDLVYFERMDNTQYGSLRIAQDKARSAALFRRPTKAFADRVGQNDLGVLALRDASWSEGGVPIIVGGKFIGAIGTSGGSAAQDGQVSTAGAAAVK
jgi:uncharacterized protein GlcG (DUF336 family)